MPGAVLCAWRALLALVLFASAPWVLGQAPAPPSSDKPMPPRKAPAPESMALSEAHQRLEEMKVELALLADIDSFPYPVAASFRGDKLELYGFVPDDIIQQNVVDVARRNTHLKVFDNLGIRSDSNTQSAARPAEVLQKEGTELLRTHLRDRAKQMSLRVRTDSVLVLTGRVDSMERKLQISRLFRQLPGCAGVDNQLTLDQIVRAGQCLVQVTRDGSMCVAPSAVGLQPETLAATPPPQKVKQVSFTDKQAPASAAPPPIVLPAEPNPLHTHCADAKKGELRLPSVVTSKQLNTPSKPAPEKVSGQVDVLDRPKLPVKWGRPTENWEGQLKQLEPVHDRRPTMPQPLPEQPKLPIALPPVETRRTPNVPAQTKFNPASVPAQSNAATPRTVRPPEMTWKRPGGEEHSEPRIAIATSEQNALPRTTATAPSLPPLRSPRRWPPAYVSSPQPSKGRPGTIIFADNPPPPPPKAEEPVVNSRRLTPADLQLQVKSLCGRQASDVAVSVHIDGSLLVRVKVPNRSIEDQLSRKILALPVMSSSQVRLLMEVGP